MSIAPRSREFLSAKLIQALSNATGGVGSPCSIEWTLEYLAGALQNGGGQPPEGEYQLLTEKGQPNGYASLGANALVPVIQLGTGTPSASNFLRGDGMWQVPPGGGTGAVDSVDGQTGAVDLSGSYVNVTGDTMSGTLTVPTLNVSGALGTYRVVRYQQDGVDRWSAGAVGDIGTSYQILGYNDGGSVTGYALKIDRSSLAIDIGASLTIQDDPVLSRYYSDQRYLNTSGDNVTGALTIQGNAVGVSPDAGNVLAWHANGFYVPTPPASGLDQATADARYVNVTGDTMSGPLSLTGATAGINLGDRTSGSGFSWYSNSGSAYLLDATRSATPIQITNTGTLNITPVAGNAALMAAGAILPGGNNQYDLGDGSLPLRWRKVWAVNADFTNAPTVGGSPLLTQTAGDARYPLRTDTDPFPVYATDTDVSTLNADVQGHKTAANPHSGSMANVLANKGDLVVGQGVTNYALAAQGATLSLGGFGSTTNPGNAIDGDDATSAFIGNAAGEDWITVDLGSARTIASYRLRHQSTGVGGATITWTLDSSPDNSVWTQRATGTVGPSSVTESGQVPISPSVSARYWRYRIPPGQNSITDNLLYTIELNGAGTVGDPVRLGVGTNNQILTADNTQPNGVKWATPVTYLDQATADTRYVNVSGDTMTGTLQVTVPTSTVGLYVSSHEGSAFANNTSIRLARQSVSADDQWISFQGGAVAGDMVIGRRANSDDLRIALWNGVSLQDRITISPYNVVTIAGLTDPGGALLQLTAPGSAVIGLNDGTHTGRIGFVSPGTMIFYSDSAGAGVQIGAAGNLAYISAAGQAHQWYVGGVNIGQFLTGIVAASNLRIYSPANIELSPAGGTVSPSGDGSANLGAPAQRWGTVYAAAGAINTCSREVKDEIELASLDDAIYAVRNTPVHRFTYKINMPTQKLPPSCDSPDEYNKHLEQIAQAKAALTQYGFYADEADPMFLTGKDQANPSNSIGVLIAALQQLDQRLRALESV